MAKESRGSGESDRGRCHRIIPAYQFTHRLIVANEFVTLGAGSQVFGNLCR